MSSESSRSRLSSAGGGLGVDTRVDCSDVGAVLPDSSVAIEAVRDADRNIRSSEQIYRNF